MSRTKANNSVYTMVCVPTIHGDAGSRRRWRQGSASERSGLTHTLPLNWVLE